MQQMHCAKKSIKDSYDNKLVARLIFTEQFQNHSIDYVISIIIFEECNFTRSTMNVSTTFYGNTLNAKRCSFLKMSQRPSLLSEERDNERTYTRQRRRRRGVIVDGEGQMLWVFT